MGNKKRGDARTGENAIGIWMENASRIWEVFNNTKGINQVHSNLENNLKQWKPFSDAEREKNIVEQKENDGVPNYYEVIGRIFKDTERACELYYEVISECSKQFFNYSNRHSELTSPPETISDDYEKARQRLKTICSDLEEEQISETIAIDKLNKKFSKILDSLSHNIKGA